MIKGLKNFYLLIAALIIAVIIPYSADAQPGTWAASIGSPLADYASDILADDAGNVYVCGNFRDTLDFGNGLTLAAAGKTDVFLAKYDAAGQVSWARRYGWFENEFSHSLGFDLAGNVIMVGEYQDSIIFTTDTIFSLDTLWYGPYSQTYDVFILKVDPSGNQLKVTADGWFGSENAYDVEVDYKGRVFFAGMFRTFNKWVGKWGKGYDEVMLMYLDTAGVFKGEIGGGRYIDKAREVEIVNDTNYIVAGTFQDTCWFDGDTQYLITDFNDDVFVARYDDTLALTWLVQVGGPGIEIVNGMETDAANNIYLAGIYGQTMNIGSTSLTSAGELDGYLVKMDPNGNVVWAKTIGGTGFDGIQDVCMNPANGELLVTGYFQGEMTVGGTTLVGVDSLDQQAFVLAFDAQGVLQWANSGGGSSLDKGIALSFDAAGYAYVLGTYNATASFGQATLVSAGSEDLFVLRMESDGSVSATPAVTASASEVVAFPNPAHEQVSIRFRLEKAATVELSILDLQGRTVRAVAQQNRFYPGVHTLTADLQGLSAGMYLYRLESNGQTQTGKLVVR